MAKKLIVSRQAYINIDEIVEFNNFRNKSDVYSTKFVKKLFKEFQSLSKQPFMGKLTSKNTYVLIWDSYCIYYLIDDVKVTILSVNHQKQNIR